jgi:hypothetical protein
VAETRAPHAPPGRWELIGPTDCPLMWRWTLLATRWGKVMVHRFVGGATDKDPHDHPAAFVTLVLRGGYDDVQPCSACEGGGEVGQVPGTWSDLGRGYTCGTCRGAGEHVDVVRAPTLRHRPATHAHLTRVHPDGALTLVIMGRKVRAWGFLRRGAWYAWQEYERRFGLNWRCP